MYRPYITFQASTNRSRRATYIYAHRAHRAHYITEIHPKKPGQPPASSRAPTFPSHSSREARGVNARNGLHSRVTRSGVQLKIHRDGACECPVDRNFVRIFSLPWVTRESSDDN